MKSLFAGLLLWSLLPASAVEAPKPRQGEKLIVLNDDGYSLFHSGHYQTVGDLQRQVLALQSTQIAVFEWSVEGGSRTNYPSRVTELIGDGVTEFPRRGDKLASDTIHRLAAQGVDTLQVVAAACHEAGLACYASLRMNGDYPLGYMGETLPRMMNSKFWWAHPEFRERGPKNEEQAGMSYAYPEVRAFRLALLREMAEHEIDGINLDYLRHPNFFGYDAPLLQAFSARYGEDARKVAATDPRWFRLRADIMTGFVREVRAILDEAGRRRGHRLGLSVRVDWKGHVAQGLDLAAWIKEGLLDYAVVGQHGAGGYEFDLRPFVAMARGTGCALLFGEEDRLTGHDLTAKEDKLIAAGQATAPPSTTLSLEQYQARAARWYAAGADGIELFNAFNVNDRRILSGLGHVPAVGPGPASKPQL